MPLLSQFPTLVPLGVITCTPFFSAVEDFKWTASIQRAPVSRLSSKGKSNTAGNPLSPSMLEPSLTYSPPRGWTGGDDSPYTKNSLVGGGLWPWDQSVALSMVEYVSSLALETDDCVSIPTVSVIFIV